MPAPTAHTRTFALLGDPVAHSLSPVLQNAAMRRCKLDALYVALACERAQVAGLLAGLAHAGGGGNVTIPHKGAAARIVDAPSARVRATIACNTFWLRGRRVHGENTDVPAFAAALANVIADVRGARALIVGAGGAARAVLYSLLESRCAGVTVLGRSRARAREIAHVAGKRGRHVAFVTRRAAVKGEGFDIVINATPLGQRPGDALPFRFESLAGVRAAFDVVYRPGGTDWVHYARRLGIPAVEGSEMLLRQAAAAFELWFERAAPLPAMRAALRRAGQPR